MQLCKIEAVKLAHIQHSQPRIIYAIDRMSPCHGQVEISYRKACSGAGIRGYAVILYVFLHKGKYPVRHDMDPRKS